MEAYNFDNIEEHTIAEWVPISKMFVDSYTRPVSEVQINRMLRAGFDADKLGALMLSLRADGRYAILDGNHRVQAARKVGITQMFARVFIDKTFKQEAELFIAFNTVNRPSALDRFRARLEMGEMQSVEIQQILQKHGMSIALSGPCIGGVSSVAALDRLYDEQGPVGFYAVVNTLHRAWGQERRAWVSKMIDGARQFWLRYHDEADRERWVDRLALVTPERLLAEAGVIHVKSASFGSLIGQTMAVRYNSGLKTKRLSDWVDRPGTDIHGKSRRPNERSD